MHAARAGPGHFCQKFLGSHGIHSSVNKKCRRQGRATETGKKRTLWTDNTLNVNTCRRQVWAHASSFCRFIFSGVRFLRSFAHFSLRWRFLVSVMLPGFCPFLITLDVSDFCFFFPGFCSLLITLEVSGFGFLVFFSV